ncbi:MAG: hypothetical protein LBN00_01690 [Oscillospiraceae bacterium]|jgi:hypothetical protein|nr:hypothetical protein [Oscillospiraceae bacterium]
MRAVTAETTRREYLRGVAHNNELGLYETVRRNSDFFVGRQWEGVNAGDLPKPVFNFIKRSVVYAVQSLSASSLRMTASFPGGEEAKLSDAVTREFDSIFEQNNLVTGFADFLRNAAVHGDACMTARWDADAANSRGGRGAIVAELVDNDRVFFGSPASADVEDQPYIIISRREMIGKARSVGAKNGVPPDAILPDEDAAELPRELRDDDARVTVLLRFWKSEETKTVWCCECCRDVMLRKPWDTGLTRYPLIWLPWDDMRDSYHGQALVTALIPNQIFVNKLFAMSMLSLISMAHPKIVYDRTRIAKWDNRAGAAIPMLGGDVGSVARVIEPAHLSPQVAQFIDLTISYSQTLMGATPAALGEVRPDNSSAIVALQKASALPNELTRQRLYRCVEDFGRILIDMQSEYYGKCSFDGETVDFTRLKSLGASLRLDVGSAAYWSEYAMVATLDNLLTQGRIDFVEYLERLPDAHLPGKKALLEKARAAKEL